MQPRELLEIMTVAERLKDTTRHCYTTKGRHESVGEHCWMMTLMAFFLRDEFPEADMDKVMKMIIIHDLGEAFTGDIPAFDKTAEGFMRICFGCPHNMVREAVKRLGEALKEEE